MESNSYPDRIEIVESYKSFTEFSVRQSCVESQVNTLEVRCLPLKPNLGVFEWGKGRLVVEYFKLVDEYNDLSEKIEKLISKYRNAISSFVELVDPSYGFVSEEEMEKSLEIDVPSDYFDDQDGYKVEIFAVRINNVRIPLELLKDFFDRASEEILTKFLLYKEKLVVDNNVFGQMIAFSVDLYTHDIIRFYMLDNKVSHSKIAQVWKKLFLGQ